MTMPRSNLSKAEQIKQCHLRGHEMKLRAKRLLCEQVLREEPDAVGPVYDMLKSLGLMKKIRAGGESSDDDMQPARKKNGKGVIEETAATQKRKVKVEEEREKREKEKLVKVPTKYLELREMSVGMLQKLCELLVPALTASACEQHIVIRGHPEKNKEAHLRIIEACTGEPGTLRFTGDLRFLPNVEKHLIELQEARGNRYRNMVPPIDLEKLCLWEKKVEDGNACVRHKFLDLGWRILPEKLTGKLGQEQQLIFVNPWSETNALIKLAGGGASPIGRGISLATVFPDPLEMHLAIEDMPQPAVKRALVAPAQEPREGADIRDVFAKRPKMLKDVFTLEAKRALADVKKEVADDGLLQFTIDSDDDPNLGEALAQRVEAVPLPRPEGVNEATAPTAAGENEVGDDPYALETEAGEPQETLEDALGEVVGAAMPLDDYSDGDVDVPDAGEKESQKKDT